MSKILTLAVIMLIMPALLLGTALAFSVLKSYPIEINIVEGVKDLGVYSNPDMTIDWVPPISWTEFGRGDVQTVTFYLRNEGVEPITVGLRALPDLLTWGEVTLPTVTSILNPGELWPAQLTIYVYEDSELGLQQFTVEIFEP